MAKKNRSPAVVDAGQGNAIRELMAPPEPAAKRPIGFVTPEEIPAKPKAAKAKK